jgi:hypothetical protein
MGNGDFNHRPRTDILSTIVGNESLAHISRIIGKPSQFTMSPQRYQIDVEHLRK